MDISIIIPTLGNLTVVEKAVISCLTQDYEQTRFEVLVVANGRNDILRQRLRPLQRQFPNLKFFETETIGANTARNIGIAKAKGEIFYFLDDDCRIRNTKQLQQIYQRHRQEQEMDALGGIYSSPRTADILCRYYNLFTRIWLRFHAPNRSQAKYLLGGNASYKARVFASGIRFREELRYGGTETELNHRLYRAGAILCLDEQLAVEHEFNGSWWTIPQRAWRQGRAKARLYADTNKYRVSRNGYIFRQVRRIGSPGFALFLGFYYLIVQLAFLKHTLLLQKKRWCSWEHSAKRGAP